MVAIGKKLQTNKKLNRWLTNLNRNFIETNQTRLSNFQNTSQQHTHLEASVSFGKDLQATFVTFLFFFRFGNTHLSACYVTNNQDCVWIVKTLRVEST